MKIVYYFKELQTNMFLWQRSQIFNELKKHGHTIIVVNPLDYDSIEIANDELLNIISEYGANLFMSCHGADLLFGQTLKKIKIPKLQICFDNLTFPYQYKDNCRYFDLVWITASETQWLFNRWGAKTIFLPYACNPDVNVTTENIEYINEVCFVGTPYGSRVNEINNILEKGHRLTLFFSESPMKEKERLNIKLLKNYTKFKIGRRVIYGSIKQRISKFNKLNKKSDLLKIMPTLSQEQMFQTFSKYSLSLSITEARNTGSLKKPVQIINLRSFEIPMAGGLQICKYNKELSAYFEEDQEIVFYRDKKELDLKLNFYLNPKNQKLVQTMKTAARLRAMKDHKWIDRFNAVFTTMGLL